MQRLLATTFLLCALPLAAFANEVCTFTTECLEGEACNDTSVSAEILGGQDDNVTFETEAETLTGRKVTSGDTTHFIFAAASAGHLVTRYADGAARYTLHMDGPFTITYHGTCEEAD